MSVKTRRVGAGVYETPDGYTIQWGYTRGRSGDAVRDGWNVINAAGEWCQWFPTKADAVETIDTWRKVQA